MRAIFLLACLAPLSACATTAGSGYCRGADLRREAYTLTIAVADAAISEGKGTTAVLLGRETAATALSILNANCPIPAS